MGCLEEFPAFACCLACLIPLSLSSRYAVDVNVDRAEDVLTHKRLLAIAEYPENRPAFHVRPVHVRGPSHAPHPQPSTLNPQPFNPQPSHSLPHFLSSLTALSLFGFSLHPDSRLSCQPPTGFCCMVFGCEAVLSSAVCDERIACLPLACRLLRVSVSAQQQRGGGGGGGAWVPCGVSSGLG